LGPSKGKVVEVDAPRPLSGNRFLSTGAFLFVGLQDYDWRGSPISKFRKGRKGFGVPRDTLLSCARWGDLPRGEKIRVDGRKNDQRIEQKKKTIKKPNLLTKLGPIEALTPQGSF